MQRNRIVVTHAGEVVVRRAACAHVVLRVHLEPADVRPSLENVPIMLRLETDPGASRDRCMRPGGGGAELQGWCHGGPSALDGLERSLAGLAVGQGDRHPGARALLDELPAVRVEIDLRGSGAGIGTLGGTVVVTSLGNTEAFLLVGGGLDGGGLSGGEGQRRGQGAGKSG